MKLKFIILVFFVVSSYAAQAQKAKLLVGQWKFKDVGDKEQVDSVGLKMIPVLFAEMTLEFKKDNKYGASIMGKSEEGTYSLDKKETQIKLTSSKGKENSMELLNVTDKELWIRVGTSKKGFIIMERTDAAPNK